MARTALMVHLDVRPESFSEFLDLARAHGANSQQIESGCLHFDVMKSVEEENHVVLVEVYENDEALESHWISEHMVKYLEQVDDLIVERQRYRCEC